MVDDLSLDQQMPQDVPRKSPEACSMAALMEYLQVAYDVRS